MFTKHICGEGETRNSFHAVEIGVRVFTVLACHVAAARWLRLTFGIEKQTIGLCLHLFAERKGMIQTLDCMAMNLYWLHGIAVNGSHTTGRSDLPSYWVGQGILWTCRSSPNTRPCHSTFPDGCFLAEAWNLIASALNAEIKP